MNTLDVPVVLVVFNRPERAAEVFAAIRAARPSTLLVVVDGPRAHVPDDEARTRAVRAVVDRVDWPCDVERNVSAVNLGCDARVRTGLDWAFSLVDRAIVLEDDLVPDPSFFPWCEAMLERYAETDDVMHVTGRNLLVRWGPPGVDHLLTRRGSVHGWATWASSWGAVDHDLAFARDPTVMDRVDELGLDPLVREHCALHLAAAAHGRLAWDVSWSTARLLAGGWSVTSPVNLVTNRGFDAQATRTVHADDWRAELPRGAAPPVVPRAPRPEPDPEFDRLGLVAELLATYRDPAMVARLARFRGLLTDADGHADRAALHHLAAWDAPEESWRVVRHLRENGVMSPTLFALEPLLDALARRGSAAAS